MAKGLWPVINVSNVEKTVEYYKGLGLPVRKAQMEGVPYGTLTLGADAGLILWGKDNIAPDQSPDTKNWLSGELGKGILFTVGVGNARKTWERVQALHANVDTPIEPQPWGGFGFNIIDPDGYVLNISDKFPNMSPQRRPAKKANAKGKPTPKAKKAGAKGAPAAKRKASPKRR